jgi:replicative DNA helicase
MNAPANIDHAALSSIDLEQEILGVVLVSNSALEIIEREVSADDFSEPTHKAIFETIVSVYHTRGMVSPVLVVAGMGGDKNAILAEGVTLGAYIARLAAAACAPGSAKAYAKQIREFANRRKILAMAETMSQGIQANQPAADIAGVGIELLDDIAMQASAGATPQVAIRDADDQALAAMQFGMQNGGKLPGLSCGFASIDQMTGGLKRGEMVVIAGRPGMGKSALGVCISNATAAANVPTMFFSLEMSATSLSFRGLTDLAYSRHLPIKYQDAMRGTVSDVDAQRIFEARHQRREWPLKVDQTAGLTVSQIVSRARRHNQNLERQGRRLGLIIVDHLHMVHASSRYSGNRVNEVTEISGGLKGLAKDLDVPVIVLAQLNRALENREDKRPNMADLRDSGSIEQDADAIIFVYREAYHLERSTGATPEKEAARIDRLVDVKDQLEAIIAKQRNGPTGTVHLFCDIACNVVRDQGGER